jgi:hypothetical protein
MRKRIIKAIEARLPINKRENTKGREPARYSAIPYIQISRSSEARWKMEDGRYPGLLERNFTRRGGRVDSSKMTDRERFTPPLTSRVPMLPTVDLGFVIQSSVVE